MFETTPGNFIHALLSMTLGDDYRLSSCGRVYLSFDPASSTKDELKVINNPEDIKWIMDNIKKLAHLRRLPPRVYLAFTGGKESA